MYIGLTGYWAAAMKYKLYDDVIKWNHFPRYGPLHGEFTGHMWIPLTKANDLELWCFLWHAPEQKV